MFQSPFYTTELNGHSLCKLIQTSSETGSDIVAAVNFWNSILKTFLLKAICLKYFEIVCGIDLGLSVFFVRKGSKKLPLLFNFD